MTVPSGSPPIIAFLTDFGTSDHYVGAMKGAVLTVCPTATLIDVTHAVPPQDIRVGSRLLAESFAFFPQGTIFVCVVDPGVGSARAGLAADAGGYRFVAPDNGLLGVVFDLHPPTALVALTSSQHVRASVSRTFEGRDRFAPVAGWLGRGVPVADLGVPLHDWVRLPPDGPRVDGGTIRGHVVRVDHFGNLITNIPRGLLGTGAGAGVDVSIGGHVVRDLVATYAEGQPGRPCVLFDSSECLEIAVPLGSAAAVLGVRRGDPVVVSRATERPC